MKSDSQRDSWMCVCCVLVRGQGSALGVQGGRGDEEMPFDGKILGSLDADDSWGAVRTNR